MLNDLKAGFGYIKKGFHFFGTNRKLWIYSVIPTLINLVFLALSIFILIHFYEDLTGWIFGSSRELAADASFLLKVWHYFLVTTFYVFKVLLFLIILILVLLTTFVFSMIVAGPFNDMLSEKVEQILTGNEIPFSWGYLVKSAWRSIVVELQKAGFFLSIPLLLLIFNLIPGLGSIVYVVLASIFTSYDIGFNFVDYPMSRKLWKFGERMRFGWERKYKLMGFGILGIIPLFAYFFASPMVVGGTLMFIEEGKPTLRQAQGERT